MDMARPTAQEPQCAVGSAHDFAGCGPLTVGMNDKASKYSVLSSLLRSSSQPLRRRRRLITHPKSETANEHSNGTRRGRDQGLFSLETAKSAFTEGHRETAEDTLIAAIQHRQQPICSNLCKIYGKTDKLQLLKVPPKLDSKDLLLHLLLLSRSLRPPTKPTRLSALMVPARRAPTSRDIHESCRC